MNNKEIRREARYLLKGNWLKLSLVFFIFFILLMYATYAPLVIHSESIVLLFAIAITGFILTVLIVPFAYGVLHSHVKAANGEPFRIFEFASVGFKSIKKAYLLIFLIIIRLAVPILAFVLSAMFLEYGRTHFLSFVTVTGWILYLIATFFLFSKLFYYLISTFILIDNDDDKNYSISKVLNESKEIMTLERVNLAIFILYFLVLLLVITVAIGLTQRIGVPSEIVALLLMIGHALFYPYFQMSMYVFYRYHKDPHYKYTYEQHVKEKEAKKEEKRNNNKSEEKPNEEPKKKKKNKSKKK